MIANELTLELVYCNSNFCQYKYY